MQGLRLAVEAMEEASRAAQCADVVEEQALMEAVSVWRQASEEAGVVWPRPAPA